MGKGTLEAMSDNCPIQPQWSGRTVEGAGTLHCKAIRAPGPEGEDGGLCAQSCPTLCDPMDCSLPGSSTHGVFQARILERVAIPSSWDVDLVGGKEPQPGCYLTSPRWAGRSVPAPVAPHGPSESCNATASLLPSKAHLDFPCSQV